MNKFWSTYMLEPEKLYISRELKFRDENKDLWLKALQIENGMKVLEIGCGSGILSHKVKQHLPDCDVTGIDLDLNNIEYAKNKAKELNLKCTFIPADATELPFEDNTFDVCFSHTVSQYCEPVKFTSEQYRVLKPGGKIILMTAMSYKKNPYWVPDETCEELELFERLCDESAKTEITNVKIYENDATAFCSYFDKQGFSNINTDVFSVMYYNPYSANTDKETAIKEFNLDRMMELGTVICARNTVPDYLTDIEFNSLIDMINRRFDKKIDNYINGERLWESTFSTTLVISAVK